MESIQKSTRWHSSLETDEYGQNLHWYYSVVNTGLYKETYFLSDGGSGIDTTVSRTNLCSQTCAINVNVVHSYDLQCSTKYSDLEKTQF